MIVLARTLVVAAVKTAGTGLAMLRTFTFTVPTLAPKVVVPPVEIRSVPGASMTPILPPNEIALLPAAIWRLPLFGASKVLLKARPFGVVMVSVPDVA